MALETWLVKVKKTMSHGFLDSVRAAAPNSKHHQHHQQLPIIIIKNNYHNNNKSKVVGVLAFEISGLMSKLLHLWQSLSDKNVTGLRSESTSLEGIRKIISNDESFLLGLACAEMVENLRLVANSASRISKKCENPNLRSLDRLFHDFAETGSDPHNWVLSSKEMEAKNIKKMDRYVNATASLHRQMDEVSLLENGLRKSCHHHHHAAKLSESEQNPLMISKKIMDLQQKIVWLRQEIKYLKAKSLWGKTFDSTTLILARSIFTVLSRIKLVFGIGFGHVHVSSLPRSLSASATVYPSENPSNPPCNFGSVPLMKTTRIQNQEEEGFLEVNTKILKPPPSTLGAAALALHYANLIIIMEKMVRSPQLVGVDARDDLYSMLPNTVRSSLRARLRGVGFSAGDPVLAGEWREALGKILGWLSPLAHNMIKWQSERSFEQQHQNLNIPKTNVLLLQTLYFANQEKTEAAITELLVGLNYIWRFEREMNAKALLECTTHHFNGFLNNSPISS